MLTQKLLVEGQHLRTDRSVIPNLKSITRIPNLKSITRIPNLKSITRIPNLKSISRIPNLKSITRILDLKCRATTGAGRITARCAARTCEDLQRPTPTSASSNLQTAEQSRSGIESYSLIPENAEHIVDQVMDAVLLIPMNQ
jgi:hypothetical protein